MPAGSIVIDLLMRTGQFETDTARAEKTLKKFQKQAEDVGKAIGLTLVGGVTLAAAAFESLVTGAAGFKDLEEQTGATAQDLASLAIAASVAGTSVADIAGQANKLTKNLSGVDDESKAAGAALAALGIPIEDFKKLDPVGQIDALTKAFGGFADGSQKTAVAMALFGKSGAVMLNVFKELQAEGGRNAILTQQQIDLADDYADKQAKQVATLKAYAQVAATDVLPALAALTGAFKDGFAELVGLDAAGKKLSSDNPIKVFAEDAGRAVANLLDYVTQSTKELSALIDFGVSYATIAKQLASFDITGAKQTGADFRARFGLDANGRKILAESGSESAHTFLNAYEKSLKAGKDAAANPAASDGRPQLDFAGANKKTKPDAEAQSALKKELDGQLKLIQDFGKNQADALKVGESYLDIVYQTGIISQRDFFDTQKNIRDAALADQLATFDKELDALRAFAANPATKPADRVSANEKIKLAEQQRSEAVTKASAADILAAQQNARAVEQLQDRYTDLRATVLAGSGDEFGAAQLKNAQQVRDAARLVQQAGGDPAVVEQLKLQLSYRAQAAEQQKEYSKLLEATQSKEAEIYLDAQAAGKGELETLAAVRDARMAALALLQAQAKAAADLAALSGNDDDVKRANELALALKKAQAEIDPLATKINASLEDSLSGAFSGFLSGTKSAKDAFRDFANSVISNIADIAAKNLAKQVFGDTGGSSGLGGLLSSLFGSGSGSGTNTTGTSLPTAGGAATGTNFVERDMLTILHKGEAVVPKAYNPAAGGGGVTIINQGARVTQQGTDQDGNPKLLVESIVNQAQRRTAADMLSGTGIVATSARTRFGLGAGNLQKRG